MLELQQLYQKISAYELDVPSHEIGFVAHLMRTNGWSRPFALRAIEEYRKLVFLALVADHQVTPSDQVDQVWHLHLLCSDAYWNYFCPRVLGRPLHHHPTKGGQAERERFQEQYRATIDSYRQHFGEPPADLWPPLEVRFGRDLQMQRGPIRRMFRPWRGWRWGEHRCTSSERSQDQTSAGLPTDPAGPAGTAVRAAGLTRQYLLLVEPECGSRCGRDGVPCMQPSPRTATGLRSGLHLLTPAYMLPRLTGFKLSKMLHSVGPFHSFSYPL